MVATSDQQVPVTTSPTTPVAPPVTAAPEVIAEKVQKLEEKVKEVTEKAIPEIVAKATGQGEIAAMQEKLLESKLETQKVLIEERSTLKENLEKALVSRLNWLLAAFGIEVAANLAKLFHLFD